MCIFVVVALVLPGSALATIGKDPQTIIWDSLRTSATNGEPDFKVVAHSDAGEIVTYSADGSCDKVGYGFDMESGLSWIWIETTAVGTCTITASAPGNLGVFPGRSVGSFYVFKGTQQLAFLTDPSTLKMTRGDTLHLPAISTNLRGELTGLPVDVESFTPSTCSAYRSSGTTWLTAVAAGTCTLRAVQAGSSEYNYAATVTKSFVIGKVDQSIDFPTLWNMSAGSADFSLSNKTWSSSGLPLTFSVAVPSTITGTPSQCTVSGATVHLTGAVGSCTITAFQPGNDQYNRSESVTNSFYVGDVRANIEQIAKTELRDHADGGDCRICTGNWCAGWAKWVWSKAGVPDRLGLGMLNPWAHSFYDYGTTYGTYSIVPHLGDAVVFLGHDTSATDRSKWDTERVEGVGIQHVAIVTGVDSENRTFTSIGGNQGGVVSETGPYSWTVGAWAANNGKDDGRGYRQVNGAGTFKIGGFISPVGIDRTPIVHRPYLMLTGDTVSGSFAVSSAAGETASLGITIGLHSEVDLRLYRPDGSLVSPSDPGVTYTRTPNSLEVSVIDAQPGVWNYEITAVELDPAGEDVQFSVESTPVMTAFVGQDAGESQYLQPATFTATLRGADGMSIPTGSVQFNLDGSPAGDPVALDSAGQASWTTNGLSVGSHTVGVDYLGSDPFVAHSAAAVTHVVTRADQTIDFGPLAARTYGDADFSVSATASSGLAVTFAASANCTVSGTTVHITGAGSCTVTATQPGDGNYNPAPDVARTFSIAKKALTITANNATKRYGQTLSFAGTEFSVAGLVPGDGVASVTLTSAGQSAGAQPGSYAIVASAALGTGLANYDIGYLDGSLTVNLVAIVGLDGVTLSGNAKVDSDGGAPNVAFVVSNGSIAMSGNSSIHGDLRSTQGSVSLTGNAVVTGNAFAGTTIGKASSIRGLASPNSPVTALTAPSVAACSPYSSSAGLGGSFSYDTATGNLSVSGNKTVTLAAGTYCFGSITLSGNARLVVNGPVSISLTGQFSATGGSVVNQTNNAANLQISSSFAGNDGVVVSGNATAYLTVYAPAAQVVLSGNSQIEGLVLGKSVTVSGNASIHQDASASGVWAGYYRN
jgi:hypothetical protein